MPDYQTLHHQRHCNNPRYSAILSVLVNHLHTYSHLCQTPSFVSHTHFCPLAWPASSLDFTHLEYLWWGHIKDTAYWQKSQPKKEFLEQITESADCIRENNEIIRKAINFLWDKKSCAFRKADIILNTNQGKLLNTDIHWYCLIKKDVLLH